MWLLSRDDTNPGYDSLSEEVTSSARSNLTKKVLWFFFISLSSMILSLNRLLKVIFSLDSDVDNREYWGSYIFPHVEYAVRIADSSVVKEHWTAMIRLYGFFFLLSLSSFDCRRWFWWWFWWE